MCGHSFANISRARAVATGTRSTRRWRRRCGNCNTRPISRGARRRRAAAARVVARPRGPLTTRHRADPTTETHSTSLSSPPPLARGRSRFRATTRTTRATCKATRVALLQSRFLESRVQIRVPRARKRIRGEAGGKMPARMAGTPKERERERERDGRFALLYREVTTLCASTGWFFRFCHSEALC